MKRVMCLMFLSFMCVGCGGKVFSADRPIEVPMVGEWVWYEPDEILINANGHRPCAKVIYDDADERDLIWSANKDRVGISLVRNATEYYKRYATPAEIQRTKARYGIK